MNLRQKVKHAKRELKLAKIKLDNAKIPYDIYESWQEVNRLTEIINFKRKPNEHFNWNEDSKVNMNNLTHVELKANYESLYKMVSPNGKPFTSKEIETMNKEILKRISLFGHKFAGKIKNEKNYIDYYLLVSDYKTKQKKLAKKNLFRQFEGDSNLHGFK